MNTVKDLMNNEELINEITEDLEDFDENATITYEVWAIGYNGDSCITDTEMLIGEFDDPEKAIEKAKALTLADIVHQASEEDDGTEPDESVAYISIEVETVVEDEDEGTMNVGTIFRKEIWVSEEETSEEGTVEETESIVELSSKDFELDDEGNLIVSRELLKDYNKNDQVRFHFADEKESGTFSYKIISKTTANNFICEFIY